MVRGGPTPRGSRKRQLSSTVQIPSSPVKNERYPDLYSSSLNPLSQTTRNRLTKDEDEDEKEILISPEITDSEMVISSDHNRDGPRQSHQSNGVPPLSNEVPGPNHGTQERPPRHNRIIPSSQNSGASLNDADNVHATNVNAMGEKIRELHSIVNEIKGAGAESLESKLPRIIVVGDQSAGKSSLVEGLSQIRVPRSDGKTTACPVEIQLEEDTSSGARWRCTVQIVKKYAFSPLRRGDTESSSATNRIGPWVGQFEEAFLFRKLERKDDLENVLFWAHQSTMNPHISIETFIDRSMKENFKHAIQNEDPNEQFFSPNVVRVNIKGPNLPSLSFVDLPGVINNTEKPGQDFLVDLVRQLVESYIVAEQSLILVTIAMTEDQANSTALSIVTKKGAHQRSVGVLTKPDLTQSEGQYFDVLKNMKYSLRYGYYCCLQPSNVDLDDGISYEEARRKEQEFFDDRSRWPQKIGDETAVDGTPVKNHFGIINLQKDLSRHLAILIAQGLPELSQQIDEGLVSVEHDLSLLPELKKDESLRTLENRIDALHRDIADRLNGAWGRNEFLNTWTEKTLKLGLKGELKKCGPRLDVKEPPLKDITGTDTTPTPKRGTQRTPRSQTATPSSVRHTPIIIDSDEEIADRSPAAQRRRTDNPVLTFRQIRQIKAQGATPNVPGVVHQQVYDELVKTFIKHWDPPLKHYLAQTEKSISDLFKDRLEATFADLSNTPVFHMTAKLLAKFYRSAMAEHRETILQHLELQYSTIGTLDEEAHRKLLETTLEQYRTARLLHRKQLHFQRLNPNMVPSDGAIERINERDLDPDRHEINIAIAANVAATYHIMSKFFLDFVRQHALGRLFVTLRNNLVRELEQGLELAGPWEKRNVRACELLTEHNNTESTRRRLHAEKSRLQNAKAKLAEFFKGDAGAAEGQQTNRTDMNLDSD